MTGMTSTYRDHLLREHNAIYKTTVVLKGLKGAREIAAEMSHQGSGVELPPYSKQRFQYLLMKWIIADDQV